ncbi:MAG: glycosyltransferase [Flavobacteriaceae bacterium]
MIVIVGPAYPYRGGIADTNEALAQALIKTGKQVRIVSFEVLYPQFLFPGKTQFSSGTPPDELQIDRKLHSLHPLSWYRTAQHIKSLKPEWVLFRYWTPFLGPCLKGVARSLGVDIKKLVLVDNAKAHEAKWFDTFFLSQFLTEMDGIVCLSELVKNQLDRQSHKPKLTNLHPINQNLPKSIDQKTARQALGLKTEGPVLLFFGLIRKYKGVDLLLESIYVLKKHHPQIKVLIVGEPYISLKPLLNRCHELGITDQVSFHPHFVPNAELPTWFGACDWVVQPYKSASQSGITPMAMHFERPTLVTKVGGLAEGLEKPFAQIVSPDSNAIAEGLQNCLAWEKPDSEAFSKLKKLRSWAAFGGKLVDFAQSL